MSYYTKKAKVMKKGDKYNPYNFDIWVTSRKYVSEYAATHGIIALKRNGWIVADASPTADHFVVAYKPVSKKHKCK